MPKSGKKKENASHQWAEHEIIQSHIHDRPELRRAIDTSLQQKGVKRNLKTKLSSFTEGLEPDYVFLKPSSKGQSAVELFPYLEDIVAGYSGLTYDETTGTGPSDADRIIYLLTRDLWRIGLYRPFYANHRLYKMIDWMIDPPIDLKFEELDELNRSEFKPHLDLWDDLSFHGDQTLYRHSLILYDRFAPFWENPFVAILVGTKLVHHAIHNGDHKEAFKLCEAIQALISKTKLIFTNMRLSKQQSNSVASFLEFYERTISRRKLSAEFHSLPVGSMLDHLEKIEQELERDDTASSLSKEEKVELRKRLIRQYLRCWCLYAINQLARDSRPGQPKRLRQYLDEFIDILQECPASDPEETALDMDSLARTLSLAHAEWSRLQGSGSNALRNTSKANKFLAIAIDALFESRALSQDHLRKTVQDHPDCYPNLSLDIALVGPQYILWPQVTSVLILRSTARLLRMMNQPHEMTERMWKAARQCIDECESGLNRKKIRHGKSTLNSLSSLIYRESNASNRENVG